MIPDQSGPPNMAPIDGQFLKSSEQEGHEGLEERQLMETASGFEIGAPTHVPRALPFRAAAAVQSAVKRPSG
jgi:hypothetical protein